MKGYSRRSRRGSMLRALAVFIGVSVSVALSFIAYHYNFPIYPDTVGTVGVSLIGGAFPGIVVAVATDLICTAFNPNALYFCFINTLTAIFTAWYIRKKSHYNLKRYVFFALISGFVAGGLSGLVQWGLFNDVQNSSLSAFNSAIKNNYGIPNIVVILISNILLNIIEKSLSLGIGLLVQRFLTDKIKKQIRNSALRQNPLSIERMKFVDSANARTSLSVKGRTSLMLLVVALTLMIIMGSIGISIYFNNAKKEKTEHALATVQSASDVIDGDKIRTFIQEGKKAEGYEETYNLLYYIWKSSPNVQYLYVVTFDEEYATYVFDVRDESNRKRFKIYKPGEKVAINEEFREHLPQLLAGKDIKPIETNTDWSWLLAVYKPVYDSEGRCVCYVGADVSMEYIADYMKDFIIRVFLVLSGFFVLIVAFGLWNTGVYIVYPLDSIMTGIEEFIKAGTDQRQLDDAVKKMRTINIHTADEVEKLYQAICDMASNQVEQMRSVRRLSENTAKMQDGLIITMADLVENRDSDTGAHIQKTSEYVRIIVEGLKKKGYYTEKITPKFMSDVVRSAPLHDVGKINISDNILNKPGKLTDEEYEIMKTHTTAGKMIMEKAISTVEGENYLREAKNMAAYHHERWDGKGYPEGLHGEVIPLSARIMAVADVFDALTSKRVYKPAFSLEKALSLIKEGAGTQFDEKCVEVFIDSLAEVKAVMTRYNEDH